MQICEYPVTWKLFFREIFLEQFRGRALSGNLYLVVLSLFFAFLLRTGRFRWFFLIILVILLYLLLFHWIVRARRRYKLYAALWGGEDWLRTVVFRTSSLTVLEGRSTEEMGYRNIVGLQEKEDKTARILFRNGNVLIVATDSFTDGTWEAAREKLRDAVS